MSGPALSHLLPDLGALRPALEARGGDAPVYRRIADALRERIAAGEIAPGTRLPTIRALADGLGVNRDTAALAYEALASEGLVESTVGRGTFVCRSEAVADPAPFEPRFAPVVDRLLDFERARPRFPAPEGADPLHSLAPDASLFPAEEFRRAVTRAWRESGGDLLRYGSVRGHDGLRAVLAGRLAAGGFDVAPDEVVLTQGASEGIALALRLVAEPGDAIAVEEPTYHNVLSALVSLGLRPVPVPMTGSARDRGADLAALGRALERPDVRAFYTMPTFHNPMGTTTSLEHRRAVLALAGRAGKPVIEDAYEADLRFTGRSVPSLAALDPRGIVMHLLSFSKSLFPGVRAGCIATRSARSLDALLTLKSATDLGGSLLLQAALAELLASGDYDRHLARLRRTLLRRRDALLEALAREMPAGAAWTEPEGGLQLWVELPEGVDSRSLVADAARAGVLVAPGHQFHHDARPSRGLRLAIAIADEAGIRHGVSVLGRVVKERLRARASGARDTEVRV